MPFIDLKKELNNVMFEELRQDRDNYFEAVVIKSELGKLTAGLEKFLGKPVLPKDLPLSLTETLKQYGGIMKGQTLYFNNKGGDNLIAMLWPWQDGEHTTVKITDTKIPDVFHPKRESAPQLR